MSCSFPPWPVAILYSREKLPYCFDNLSGFSDRTVSTSRRCQTLRRVQHLAFAMRSPTPKPPPFCILFPRLIISTPVLHLVLEGEFALFYFLHSRLLCFPLLERAVAVLVELHKWHDKAPVGTPLMPSIRLAAPSLSPLFRDSHYFVSKLSLQFFRGSSLLVSAPEQFCVPMLFSLLCITASFLLIFLQCKPSI